MRFSFAQTFSPLWLYTPYLLVLIVQLFGHRFLTKVAFGIVFTVSVFLALTRTKGTGRIVVTADKKILVFRSLGYGRKYEFLRETPRPTQVGSPSVSWWRSFSTLGERLYLVPVWGNKERTASIP
jgi:hypothetical protein